MASRWQGWSRRPRDETQDNAAVIQLTSTFLDMDKRQGIVESAVTAAKALSPSDDIERVWDTARNACYEAAEAYLAVMHPSAQWESGGTGQAPPTGADIQRTTHLLESACCGLDQFYDRHRAVLDSATAKAASVSSDADSAVMTAHRARQRLAETARHHLEYPSVRHAQDHLETELAELQSARDRADLAAVSRSVDRVRQAAAVVNEALDNAPLREEQARRTVASVRTRIDAVRTRAAEMPPLISALLRDFNAKSSADLVDNEKISRTFIERADALLRQAAAARDEGRPEAALDCAAQARTQLTNSERHVDAVADRLMLLRELRADPARRERDVRFRLRDAQRLAVDRDAVPEWGSVLDAQASRIDRIVGELIGPHPDYWGYTRALEEVSEFIATIVSRIRQKAIR